MTSVPPASAPAAKGKPRKRLLLLRHAKSAWPEGLDDMSRPLADRGRKAAPLMGSYLIKRKLLPDLVLLSPARRTQDTWALISKHFKPAMGVLTEPLIYEAPVEQLFSVIAKISADVDTLLLVGHNPGLEDLARQVLSSREGDQAERLLLKYPTAGLAVFEFDGADWACMQPGKGRLKAFVTPKSLTG